MNLRLVNPYNLPPLTTFRFFAVASPLSLILLGAAYDQINASTNLLTFSRWFACGAVLLTVAATYFSAWVREHYQEAAFIALMLVTTHLCIAVYEGQLHTDQVTGAVWFTCIHALVFNRTAAMVGFVTLSWFGLLITGYLLEAPAADLARYAMHITISLVFLAFLIGSAASARAAQGRLQTVTTALFDQSTDGLLYGEVHTGKVLATNRRMCELLGTNDFTQVARLLRKAYLSRYPGTTPQEIARWLSSQSLQETLKIQSIGGQWFWGDLAMVRLDIAGEALMMLRLTDATQRMEDAMQLEQTQILLDRSQAMARVGGWEYEPANDYWSLTDAARHILEIPHDIAHLWDGFDTQDHLVRDDALARCIEHGEHFDIEILITTHTGKQFTARTLGEPIFENDQVAKVVGVFMDISKTQQREQALKDARDSARAAATARTQFLANMSHEIRTPMNGIIGMASLLQSANLQPEQQHQVEIIRSSGDLLMTIINEILDFSKIDAGRMTLELLPFALDTLVQDSTQPFVHQIQNKGLSFNICWAANSDHTAVYLGDQARIRQILGNLLNNALKFTQQGGIELHIHQQRRGATTQLSIAVQDTGIGIAPEQADLLFEPFRQADTSTTRKFGGTGLGLSISLRLAKLMNGEIVLTSKPGVGSRFELRLQIASAELATTEVANPQAPITSAQPRRILVVEDNQINQTVALQILKKLNLTAQLANNGQEALDMLQQQSFDIVLMDMQMPVLDGIEATRALRKNTNIEQPYVIAMTANALAQDRDACLAAGMDDFIAKPIRIADVRRALEKVSSTTLA